MSSAAASVDDEVSTDSPRDAASGNAIRWCTTPASSPPALRSSASASRARRVFVLARFSTKTPRICGRASAAIAGALTLTREGAPCAEKIESLGGGWVAEEALAIGIYCALVADDFDQGVRLAVNHSGDSDSTGALTGNMLGALHGKAAIAQSWLDDLELRDVIEEVGRDLAQLRAGRVDDRMSSRYPGW
jgi:hypothetical protein